MNVLTRAVFSCGELNCGKGHFKLTWMLEYFAFLGSDTLEATRKENTRAHWSAGAFHRVAFHHS